jgi:protein-tyrosine phosphatase
MDCDRILANLYVGGCPSIPDELQELKDGGITAVLNLQSDDDLRNHRIDWPSFRVHFATRHIEIRRVPIIDFDDDDLRDKLPEAVQVLTEVLKQGHTVFVHCNAGINRSPSVIACYLHWREGWQLDEALQHVRLNHPCSPVTEVIRLATWDRRRGIP